MGFAVHSLVDQEQKQELQEWIDMWEIDTWETTAYAPLDPTAVEGVCYSGDPNITASGEQVVPGVTVAAGPGVPFGTTVYIEGIGKRIVQDRGGAIGNNNLDVAVWNRQDALEWGRQDRRVVIVPSG